MPSATPMAVETHGFTLSAGLGILLVCVLAFAVFLVLANLLSRSGKHRR
ncbi:MAG: hypothetical protein JO043_11405 [Candidatus Eremiobacteraeota bacterium]|nr:hypothetical protein [Candidatus Eremiobacteraeota bacterium]